MALLYADTSQQYKNLDVLYEALCPLYPTVKISSRLSIPSIFNLARAQMAVIDQSAPLIFSLPVSKDTVCLQLWHSSGLYKRIGFDAMRRDKDPEAEKKRIQRIHGRIDYFVISDPKLIQYYAKAFHMDASRILPFGLLRTDLLYKHTQPHKNKTLLYAPTFRTGKQGRFHRFLLDAVELRKELGEQWDFQIRQHPTVRGIIPSGWIDVTDKDQYECLQDADILVTDYSSILFDYSVLGRPILLLVSDIEDYRKCDRELYLSPYELNPGGVCNSQEELIKKIKENDLPENTIRMRFMSSCDGQCTQRVVQFILKVVRH